MKFSRRDLIHAGCTVAAVGLVPKSADAFWHGAAPSGNNNRVTLNVGPDVFANIAKGFGWTVPLANADSNGYPTGTLPANITTNTALQLGYFGDFVTSFSGTGSIQYSPPILVRSTNTAGVVTGIAGTSGDLQQNMQIASKTNPRVVFTPGAFIQAISQGASNAPSGGSGNYIRVTFKSGYVDGFSGIDQASTRVIRIQDSAQSGGGSVQVAGAVGTWNYNHVDSSNIDLTTSVTTGAVSVFTTGSATPGGEGITTSNNLTVYLFGTYSGFNNLVCCTTGNEAAVIAGTIWDPLLISQYQYLMNSASAPASQKGWLRFMDTCGVQGSYECDFANRMPATYLSYASSTNYFPAAYNVGTISNGGSDAYTCSDTSPVSVWDGANSRYFDSAIVQGNVDLPNATANPTLGVGGHAAAPIFDFTTNPYIFGLVPPTSGGGAMVWTFHASWLNGGSNYTFTYTTSVGASFTANSSGTTSLTVSGLTGSLGVGQVINVTGGAGGIAVITSIGSTGGGNGVYTTNVATTLSGNTCNISDDRILDGNGVPVNFNNNLVTALLADTTLTAGMILFGNSGQVVAYPQTADFGTTRALTINYTSGPSICTMTRLHAGLTVTSGSYTSATGVLVLNFAALPLGWTLSVNQQYQVSGMTGTGAVSSLDGTWTLTAFTATSATFNTPLSLGTITISGGNISNGATTLPANLSSATFIYNKILGGWIYRAGGMVVSVPFEAITQLCNQVGAHCWYNLPCYTKAAFVTALTNFMGDTTSGTGLSSGLRFGTEVGNELWNFSEGPYGYCLYLAAGIGIYPGGNDAQQWSWGALRSVQYGALAKAAWTGKGRSASDYYVFNMGNQPSANPGQSYQKYALEGFALTTTNTVYATYSGLAGGLAAADYSTSPNRPADKYLTASGHAVYWFGDYLREAAFEISGTVSDNASWLAASLNYAQGNTAAAFSALSTLFDTQRGSAVIAASGSSYNSGTGILSLALVAPINAGTATSGDVVLLYNLTGTGSSLAALNGNGFVATSGTGGTTINLNVGMGLTISSVTGGTAIDKTAGLVNPAQASNWAAFLACFNNFEAIAATYDTTRAGQTPALPKLGIFHYEAAPQWSVGDATVTNGTNSTGAAAISFLVTQMGSGGLNWNVNAYDNLGNTGATAITDVANQVVNMIQGWKYDTDHTGAAANTGSYKNMIKTFYYGALKTASAASGREVHPGQYGYQGNTWGFFPASYSQGSQYQNYVAYHEWNA